MIDDLRPKPHVPMAEWVREYWLAKNHLMQLNYSVDHSIPKVAIPPEQNRTSLIDLVAVAGTFVICLIRLGGFVQENAVNLLFNEQWVALTPLFQGRGPWSCFFLQDGGAQRMGVGGLVYWCLYWATGWNVRAEAWA